MEDRFQTCPDWAENMIQRWQIAISQANGGASTGSQMKFFRYQRYSRRRRRQTECLSVLEQRRLRRSQCHNQRRESLRDQQGARRQTPGAVSFCVSRS